MNSQTARVLGSAALGAALLAFQAPAGAATPGAAKPAIAALPFALDMHADPGAAQVDAATLVLVAKKGSDLYVNTDGTEMADTTPRVLFQPAGDFIFSARVGAGFGKPFDGAALIVYGDKTSWGKLLFELARTGKPGISTTVAKGVGDDAHHGAREGSEVYLKVVRRKDMFVFYTSPDGANWSMVRTFSLPGAGTVKVGFSAQSPMGEEFRARFSDIRFRNATFRDFWQGE
ncbi:DUF1349 domain-containing protein [Massilia atriviolacea]|uniref:DUF1349 domain-containing protein n=1 Tax=Massilia atriviolacea TaxID=2495579 RepID=A0A430HRV1_9BURK|nr:DUF1349 domain-containing protein [Massilia atriviolacea]RSZ60265.1 DUF1349 domain-containing protein [Massilia atriviolacea]